MWQYEKLSDVQKELLGRNIIDFIGDVDDDMLRYVRESLVRLVAKGSPPVTIIISSGGGSVENGLDIYDALMVYQGSKTGVVIGAAKSIAAIVLQACSQRNVSRHASILIHHISRRQVSLNVLRDENKLRELRDDMEKKQRRVYQVLASRTGRNEDEIRLACEGEKEMSSEEALAFGLVDNIVDGYTNLVATSPTKVSG